MAKMQPAEIAIGRILGLISYSSYEHGRVKELDLHK
jgi:hypothetical protein